jgi:hypothetical protein
VRLAIKKGTNPKLHAKGQKESRGIVHIACLVPKCGETYAIYLMEDAEADNAGEWLDKKLRADHDAGNSHAYILPLPRAFLRQDWLRSGGA